MTAITLDNLKPATPRKQKKRVGRGNASQGTTSGRGQKGQRARSGGRGGLKLRGLKLFVKSTPKKRGFTSPHKHPAAINLSALSVFNDGAVVSPRTVKQKGLIRNIRHGVKILGNGTIEKKVHVVGCVVSKAAKEKIEKVGGTVK
jgi:large subunit ribosomal protein L15